MSCVSVWVPNVSDFPTTELMQDNALKHGTQALELKLYAQACVTTMLRATVTKQRQYIIPFSSRKVAKLSNPDLMGWHWLADVGGPPARLT